MPGTAVPCSRRPVLSIPIFTTEALRQGLPHHLSHLLTMVSGPKGAVAAQTPSSSQQPFMSSQFPAEISPEPLRGLQPHL